MSGCVAFLQNVWLKDPERFRAMLASPRRERYLKAFLFYRCLTGRRLTAAFGDRVDSIVWEEVSREIGGTAGSVFPPDPEHVREVLKRHNPKIVLLFGKVARSIVDDLSLANTLRGRTIIAPPHPAARHATVVRELEESVQKYDVALRHWGLSGGGGA